MGFPFQSPYGAKTVPRSSTRYRSGGKEKAPQNESLTTDLNRVRVAFMELSRSFHEGFPAIGNTPLLQTDFAAIVARLCEMLERIESLRDWVDLKALERDFRERELGELFANLNSKAQSLPADDVTKAVRRSLLQAWLNW